MSVNLNQIQNRLRKTVSDINDSNQSATINFNAIQGIASRADNVLLKSIESSRKSIESVPTLENINNQIKKLNTLMPESIYQETHNYFKSSIEDLKNAKSFISNSQKTVSGILKDINKLGADNRDDAKTVTGILSSITDANLSGIITSAQTENLNTIASTRLKMEDDNADASNYSATLQALAQLPDGDEIEASRLIGSHYAATKDAGSRTSLISFWEKLNNSAKSGAVAQQKFDAKMLTSQRMSFVNSLKPEWNSLLKEDAFYDLKNQDRDSNLAKIVAMPSFESYGSTTSNNIENFQIEILTKHLVQDLIDMTKIDDFVNEDIKTFMAQHGDAIKNISSKDHRHYVRRLGNLLLDNNKPDKNKSSWFDSGLDPKVTMENSIQRRMNMLNSIYNQGAEMYPDLFTDENKQPIFGDGTPPTEKEPSINIWNNAEPVEEETKPYIPPLPEDFESDSLSPFLRLAQNYSNANADLGPYDPSQPLPIPALKRPIVPVPPDTTDMTEDAFIDIADQSFLAPDDIEPWDPPPFRDYPDHQEMQSKGAMRRYLNWKLDDDLQRIKTLRQVLADAENEGIQSYNKFYIRKAAESLAEVEEKVRNKMGKFIHPDSGIIKMSVPENYAESFDERERNDILKSLSTVNR